MAKAKEDDLTKSSDFLWKVIQRYDTYIGATNAKAALLGSFNTFVVGAIALKWQDLLTLFSGHPKLGVLAAIFVLLIAVTSLTSSWLALNVVFPYLDSDKKPGQYHSNVFFVHVSEHETAEDYVKLVCEAEGDTVTADLGKQAHALACGLTGKFRRLGRAIWLILYIQIPAITILVMLQCWTWIGDLPSKGLHP